MSKALYRTLGVGGAALLAGVLATPLPCLAQTGTAATPGQQTTTPSGATRLIGTVVESTADTLSLKLEKGGEVTVALSPQTKMVRTAPGQTTLAGATVIHAQDLTAGDRVLVRAAPGADATHFSASVVIAMKGADVAQAHAREAEDWQKRGVGGVVKTVDAGQSGAPATITASVAGGQALAIHVGPGTVLRRYAADSANFADAKPSTLAEVHPGDQLRARGDRTEDGREMTAVEIVTGSFRNVAGTILTINPAENTLTVVDVATKKPVLLKLTAETQMRRLPPQMAQRLAGRGGAGEGAGPNASGRADATAGRPGPAGDRPAPAGAPNSPATRPADATAAPGSVQAGPPAPGEARPPRDPAAMLQRAPAVTLAELTKGSAVMVVATQGSGSEAATAITLIAGVEPLLESSSGQASQNLFSASWNLTGGGGAAEGGPQ